MIYRMFDARRCNEAVASHECPDDFAAEKWARERAMGQQPVDDFVIERADGGYAASLFRTVAGQWYVMRR